MGRVVGQERSLMVVVTAKTEVHLCYPEGVRGKRMEREGRGGDIPDPIIQSARTLPIATRFIENIEGK